MTIRTMIGGAVLLLLGLAGPGQAQQLGAEVSFEARDDVKVHAYWRTQADAATAPTMLLFHMAGSSAAAEYPTIIERLNAEGYNTLAVDLRSGGARLGAPNKTAAQFEDRVPYCAAYPDMVAALDWVSAQGLTGPVQAWGSSYSAALVVKLAAERPDALAGAIAFSPASGQPLADCRPEQYLEALQIPVLALRPDSEMALESVQAQAEAFRNADVPYQVIDGGEHGSLMLQQAHTGQPMDAAWDEVLGFTAMAVQMAGERLTFTVDGWQLVAEITVPDADGPVPAMLLLHDAAGSRHVFRRFALALAANGIASLRVDLRAHGDSTNLGTFQEPWDDHLHFLDGTERDIKAALGVLKADPRIDADRVGVSGGSYSGEFMALAARQQGYEKAYIAMAPGSFTDESIEAIDASGAAWFFLRAEEEFDFFDDIFDYIRETSETAEIRVLSGDAHAADLLLDHRELAGELAGWAKVKLAR